MQWIEVTVKTTSAAIELVAERLTVLGFDSFIIDDQEEFHEFLDQNRQYWDYVDEELERQMTGLSQIRLYLEDGPAAPETVSQLRDQLSALRAQYPATRTGKTAGSSIISRCPSVSGFWLCRSGSRQRIRSTVFPSCSTPA